MKNNDLVVMRQNIITELLRCGVPHGKVVAAATPIASYITGVDGTADIETPAPTPVKVEALMTATEVVAAQEAHTPAPKAEAPAPEPKVEAPIPPAPASAEEPPQMSPEELNTAIVAEYNRLGNREGIDKVLSEYNVTSVTTLDPAVYTEVLNKIKAL